MAPVVRCLHCRRLLTSARSIAAGYGPTCLARVRAAGRTADLDGFTAVQLESARELIADGGVVPLRRDVFRTVATDGTETYLTAPQACTCPAGVRSRRCYHVAAVRMVLAARAVRQVPAAGYGLAA